MTKRGKSLKVLSIVALFVAIAGLTIACASMNETLKIAGSAKDSSAVWNIKFQNLSIDKTGGASYSQPDVSDTSLTGYTVTLAKPSDSVVFTFDVANDGDIDAILNTLSKQSPICEGTGAKKDKDASIVCKNLEYSLKYADGTNVARNDLLDEKSSKTMSLTISYKSTAKELPASAVTIKGLDLILIYIQNN